jgi:hypothetical protein
VASAGCIHNSRWLCCDVSGGDFIGAGKTALGRERHKPYSADGIDQVGFFGAIVSSGQCEAASCRISSFSMPSAYVMPPTRTKTYLKTRLDGKTLLFI